MPGAQVGGSVQIPARKEAFGRQNITISVGSDRRADTWPRSNPYALPVRRSRTSLHNSDYIADKDIRIEIRCLSKRQAISSRKCQYKGQKALMGGSLRVFGEVPRVWADAVREKDEAAYRCTVPSVPHSSYATSCISLHATRNIEGLGQKVVEQLVNDGSSARPPISTSSTMKSSKSASVSAKSVKTRGSRRALEGERPFASAVFVRH